MSWATLRSPALGQLIRAATSSTNSCLGLSCGHATLGRLLCDMSCIVNDNHTRREFLRDILYNNIAIIAIQHSKIYFVDTFGDSSHTVE